MRKKDTQKKDKTSSIFQLINSQPDLEAFAESLNGEKTVAVDLEADSMYHFKERVCLLQIATSRNNVIIDPFNAADLACLKEMFSNPDVQKIFHGADYDIRSLHRDFRINVNNLFDTQLASRFLGYEETGLNAVIQKEFNVKLDKRFQKKDWSQRPLPPEMLEYAARDSIYLIPLAERFQNALIQKKRLTWVEEECELLSNVRAASNNGDPLFLKFKGAGRLKPRRLAVLENLLQLRQTIARKKDRPPFKIFSNKAVLNIVYAAPETLQHLEATRALSRKQFSMYGAAIIKRTALALKLPEESLPVYPRRLSPRVSPRVPERLQRLKIWRDAQIQRHRIDPALICNKALMTAIADKNPSDQQELSEIEEMRAWQREAFGNDIISTLHKNSRKRKRKKSNQNRRGAA